MLTKSMVAAVLSVCLVVVSSAGASCDLSCSLPHLHSGCPEAQTRGTRADTAAAQQHTSPGPGSATAGSMSMAEGHCNHAGAGAVVTSSAVDGQQRSISSCVRKPCSETSISALSVPATNDVQRAQIYFQPLTASISADIDDLAASFGGIALRGRYCAPNLSLFDPLSINLRI